MNRSIAVLVTIAWCLAVAPGGVNADVALSGKYSTEKEGETAFDETGRIGSGSSPIRSFSMKPTKAVEGVVLEYRGRFAGQGETPWVKQGEVLSKQNANLEAVSFRLTGAKSPDYRLEYTVSSATGPLQGIGADWTVGPGGPISLIVVCLDSNVELAAVAKLPEDVRTARANSETARRAEKRKKQGAPVTATVLSACGAVLGFLYAGPEGAVVGAVFGFGLGSALENGSVKFAADNSLPSMQDIYKNINMESAGKEWVKMRDKVYDGLSDTEKKAQDWFHKIDPTKHGLIKIGGAEVKLPPIKFKP
jgi:hypothetical protein